ncbi:MAG: serine/threonine-protein kinase [Chthoniobacter sp.]
MRTTEPTQLGEFTILEKIGQGAMGAVYKARQSSLGRVVALKLLPAHYAGDADFVARFKREASAAAGLNHPNIVQIYAAGQDGGAHYFAMEYVDGESLGARLGRKGRIDPREALAVAHYVAQALGLCLEKGGHRPSRHQARQHFPLA